MQRSRWVARSAFAVTVVVLASTGYVAGFQVLPILGIHEASFAMLSFAAFILVSGVAFVGRMNGDETPRSLEEPVAAIVPTFRDAHVLHHSVESLRQQDDSVQVYVVPEPDDAAGIEAAESYAEHDDVTCLVNPHPGSKAGAINGVVEAAEADVFAADQHADPGFLSSVTGYLRDHDVVQARFVPRSDGTIESLAYYEFTLFGHAFRQLLYLATGFRMATSKALVFTRDAIESVGGYDPDVVSEDYDFAHRAYLDGQRVKLLYRHVVTEESVHTLADWWGQRKRWMTGNVQVLARLLGYLRANPGYHRSYVSLAVGVLSIGGSAFLLSIAPKVVTVTQIGHPEYALAPVLATYAVAVYARVTDGFDLGWEWLLTPLVLPLFACITVMAFADYVFDFDGEWYVVHKGD
jgi:cellulose synthase/poly-beta-1,6-N-acetylglucosamine synthase-like glycosyltransferase